MPIYFLGLTKDGEGPCTTCTECVTCLEMGQLCAEAYTRRLTSDIIWSRQYEAGGVRVIVTCYRYFVGQVFELYPFSALVMDSRKQVRKVSRYDWRPVCSGTLLVPWSERPLDEVDVGYPELSFFELEALKLSDADNRWIPWA